MVLLTLLGCIPDPTPKVTPLPPAGVPSAVAAARVATAAGYIAGRIEKIEPDATYDDPCHIIAHMIYGCSGTVTFRLKVVRADGSGKYLWVFVPGEGYMPLVAGQDGTFVYFRVTAWRYKECEEHKALTSVVCGADNLPVVMDMGDVFQLSDSAWVGTILR